MWLCHAGALRQRTEGLRDHVAVDIMRVMYLLHGFCSTRVRGMHRVAQSCVGVLCAVCL